MQTAGGETRRTCHEERLSMWVLAETKMGCYANIGWPLLLWEMDGRALANNRTYVDHAVVHC
jgi:hypothetical protein